MDSELSEDEDQFTDPKSFPRLGKANIVLSVYQKMGHRDEKKRNQRAKRLAKDIQHRSGFKKINFELSHDSSADVGLPRLNIDIIAREYDTASRSPLLSGFVNVAHARDSHSDWRIPLFHRDQEITLFDEEIFKRGCVIREEPEPDTENPGKFKEIMASPRNTLRLDFCLNQFVQDTPFYKELFKEECIKLQQEFRKYRDELKEVEEKGREPIALDPAAERQRIMEENRRHAEKQQDVQRQQGELNVQEQQRIWERSQQRPQRVAIGGPAPRPPNQPTSERSATINSHLDPRQNRRNEVKTEHGPPGGVVRNQAALASARNQSTTCHGADHNKAYNTTVNSVPFDDPHLDPRQTRRNDVKAEHVPPGGVVREPPSQSVPNGRDEQRLVQARPDRPQSHERKPTREELAAEMEAERLRNSRIPSRCLKRKQEETTPAMQNGAANPPESAETRIKKEKMDEEEKRQLKSKINALHEQVEKLKDKRTKWLANCERWREEYRDHPEYSADHEQERRFRATKATLDAKIEKLTRERASHENCLARVTVRE